MVPIGTEIRLEKDRYLIVSVRTGAKRHRYVFEHCFVYKNKTSCYSLAPPRTANPMKYCILIPAERVPNSGRNSRCLE